jgi:hypothetical protein
MRGSNLGRGKKFFHSPKGLDRPWGTPSAILQGYHSSFPGIKRQGCDVDRLYLVLRLRVCEVYILTPRTSLRGAERRGNFFMRNYHVLKESRIARSQQTG